MSDEMFSSLQTVQITSSRAQSPAPIEGRLIEIDGEEYTVTQANGGLIFCQSDSTNPFN